MFTIIVLKDKMLSITWTEKTHKVFHKMLLYKEMATDFYCTMLWKNTVVLHHVMKEHYSIETKTVFMPVSVKFHPVVEG